MNHPIKALLWEQYRQTRWQIAIAATLLVAYIAFSPAVLKLENFLLSVQTVKPDANIWFILFALIPSLFINPGEKNIEEGMPKRLFTLPVATKKLVAIQILYKLSVVALFGFVASLANQLQFDSEIPAWWAILLLFALTASLQAFFFLRAPTLSIARALTVLLLITALFLSFQILVHALGASPTSMIETDTLSEPHQAAALSLVIIAAALFLCFHNLRQARSGETGKVSTYAHPRKAHIKAHTKSKPFRSTLTAQMWFEWRNSLWHLPMVFAAISIPFAIILIKHRGIYTSIVFFPIIPIFIGFYFLRTTSTYRHFVLTRPLTTKNVAHAKLYTGACATLLAFTFPALLSVYSFLSMIASGHSYGELDDFFYLTAGILAASWIALTMGRLALTGLALIAGCALTIGFLDYMRIPWLEALEQLLQSLGVIGTVVIITGAIAIPLLILNYVASNKKWMARHYLPNLSVLMLVAWWLFVLLLGVLNNLAGTYIIYSLMFFPTTILCCEAYLRKLISIKAICTIATISLLLFTLSTILWHNDGNYRMRNANEYYLISLFGTACLAPIAWIPLVIHLQRHR